MKKNILMQQQIFEILSNQIKENNPPETKITFDRLTKLGYAELEVKKLIGQCISIEIFNALKHKIPFNLEQYICNLNILPQSPFDNLL